MAGVPRQGLIEESDSGTEYFLSSHEGFRAVSKEEFKEWEKKYQDNISLDQKIITKIYKRDISRSAFNNKAVSES